jgi:hypothetical protein
MDNDRLEKALNTLISDAFYTEGSSVPQGFGIAVHRLTRLQNDQIDEVYEAATDSLIGDYTRKNIRVVTGMLFEKAREYGHDEGFLANKAEVNQEAARDAEKDVCQELLEIFARENADSPRGFSRIVLDYAQKKGLNI